MLYGCFSGLIQGRFRTDSEKSCMAVSINWGSFLWVPCDSSCAIWGLLRQARAFWKLPWKGTRAYSAYTHRMYVGRVHANTMMLESSIAQDAHDSKVLCHEPHVEPLRLSVPHFSKMGFK